MMNCRIMSVPFSYLGLPVGGSPCRLSFWDPVILRIQKKLSNWRRNSLSFGGRICLIRSVLASIPLYFLSVFRMPVGIRKKCKSLMRGFLWGGKEGENKMAWVSWDAICKPKAMGGLGLRDWGDFNKALLGKWRWRLMTDRYCLVSKMLFAKYNGNVPATAFAWWKDLNSQCYGVNMARGSILGCLDAWGKGILFSFGKMSGSGKNRCVIDTMHFIVLLLNRTIWFGIAELGSQGYGIGNSIGIGFCQGRRRTY